MHPRWPTVLAASRRIVALVILLLTVRLLVWPLPLSNVLPAGTIGLIAPSDLEQGGLMLALALVAGMIGLGLDAKVLYDLLHALPNNVTGLALSCRTPVFAFVPAVAVLI